MADQDFQLSGGDYDLMKNSINILGFLRGEGLFNGDMAVWSIASFRLFQVQWGGWLPPKPNTWVRPCSLALRHIVSKTIKFI